MTFTRIENDVFKTALMFDLLSRAQLFIRPEIPSTRLRRALSLRIENQRGTRGSLFIPHFWALIVHDGRGPVSPRKAKFLVFFVNPADDPRRPTPQRVAQQRRLTKAEFDAGMAENQRLEQLNPSGGRFQHMIVVQTPSGLPTSTGPATGTPFFDGPGARRFVNSADDVVFRNLDRYVVDGAKAISETVVIRGKLGPF